MFKMNLSEVPYVAKIYDKMSLLWNWRQLLRCSGMKVIIKATNEECVNNDRVEAKQVPQSTFRNCSNVHPSLEKLDWVKWFSYSSLGWRVWTSVLFENLLFPSREKKNAAFEKVIRKVHLSTPQTVFGMCCGSVNKWHASPPFFAFFFFWDLFYKKSQYIKAKTHVRCYHGMYWRGRGK